MVLHRPELRLLICAFLAVRAVVGGAADARQAGPDAPITAASPDESWNAVFDRGDGWTGADVAGTVDLGDGRMLWVFGDTWVGSIRNGKRQPGSRMVNNSIAVHRLDRARPWQAPDPASVRFHWGPNDSEGKPTAWIVPARADGPPGSSQGNRDWFWPIGGGLVVPGPADSRKLVLFLFRVRHDPRGKGVWNFSIAGTTLAVVENTAAPADEWKVRLVDVAPTPAASGTEAGSKLSETTWGMSAALAATAGGRSNETLVFGVRRGGPLSSSLLLAGAGPRGVDHVESWQFYAGSGKWSTSPREATSIAEGLTSEFSVERMTRAGVATWILVQSEPLFGRRILVRCAPRPEGPWSTPKPIFTVPEVNGQHSYFTYAAKGHARISRPGELLVTYLVNSHQFADLMGNTAIYRPKFIRVPLSAIGPK